MVDVAKVFDVAFIGIAGSAHQTAAEETGVKFIPGELLLGRHLNSLHRSNRMVCGSGLQSRGKAPYQQVRHWPVLPHQLTNAFVRKHDQVPLDVVRERVRLNTNVASSFLKYQCGRS